jgi:beta-phosphoglucomutase
MIRVKESSKTLLIWPLMTNLPRPRGIILDFDGVVVDSLDLHLEAWSKATRQVFNAQLQNPSELKGLATRTIAGILAARFGDPSLARTLTKVKQQLLLDNLSNLGLVRGAREFIHAALALGLPLGIASNSRRDFVSMALKTLSIQVTVVVTIDDVARGKPRPDIFWECARQLGITAPHYGEVLVFEDSEHGIKAALAAGMKPIGLSTELPQEKLLKAGAYKAHSDLAEALSQGILSKSS